MDKSKYKLYTAKTGQILTILQKVVSKNALNQNFV